MQTTLSTQTVKVGSVEIGGPSFTVIAGPCSVESREQFLTTALAVKKSGAQLLRGGIWKVRTSAAAFQGLGQDSYSFISDVLKETGLQLVSEIMEPRQMAEIHEFVGMYQVGARNMQNTALLKELGRQKKPVLLKRGFGSLVDEWLKAADYIHREGNPNVVLCERGIRTFETATRFTLDLNSVVYVKDRTRLPVIVDPSHAVGISALVPRLAFASAAAGADGLIVEVHSDPTKALSDGLQALTLKGFDEMMSKLGRVLKAVDRSFDGKPS